jgi:hypothetical protein
MSALEKLQKPLLGGSASGEGKEHSVGESHRSDRRLGQPSQKKSSCLDFFKSSSSRSGAMAAGYANRPGGDPERNLSVEMSNKSKFLLTAGEGAAAPVVPKKLDLNAAAKGVKQALRLEDTKPFGEQVRSYFSRNWVSLLLTLLSAFPMFILYFLSNMQGENAVIPREQQDLAGGVGFTVNTAFTGAQLAQLVIALFLGLSAICKYGLPAFADSISEAVFLVFGLGAFTLSALAASLSFATSVEDGRKLLGWDRRAVDIGLNAGIILNLLLMLNASFSLVKSFAVNTFPRRDADDAAYQRAVGLIKAKFDVAQLKHAPEDLDSALALVSEFDFTDREAFRASVRAKEASLAADNRSLSQKMWTYAFRSSLISTSFALYFATIPNVISAVKNPGAIDALRTFFKDLGATNFAGAAAWNLSNLAFSVYYAYPGAMTFARMLSRVWNNYDQTPVKSVIALLVAAGLVIYSAGTSLTQALDGSGGFPWENPEFVQKTLAIASALNALFINFTALMPMFNTIYGTLGLIELAGRKVCGLPNYEPLPLEDALVAPGADVALREPGVKLAMIDHARAVLHAAGERDLDAFTKTLHDSKSTPMFGAMLRASVDDLEAKQPSRRQSAADAAAGTLGS